MPLPEHPLPEETPFAAPSANLTAVTNQYLWEAWEALGMLEHTSDPRERRALYATAIGAYTVARDLQMNASIRRGLQTVIDLLISSIRVE